MCMIERVCSVECDDIKKAICIDRVSKKQAKLYKALSSRCNYCYSRTVEAKHNKKETRLCTACNNIRREQLKGAIN